MQSVSIELEKRNVNYGFLYDRYLLDGRQKTDGVQTIVIPNGICASEAVDDLLEKFVEDGGSVIAFAPTGVFNEFGQPKSGFMAKVFPEANWTHKKFNAWDAGEKIKADNSLFYQASYGKGKVVVFRSVLDWEKMREEFNRLAMSLTRETIGTTQLDFAYCLREGAGKKYLYVLNYSAEKTQSGEMFMDGNYNATDIGMQFPVNLKNFGGGGQSRFKLKLAPAEMTLLELTKQ